MSAYRPLGPFPQYFLADGTVNNGGFIHFYQTDLTTPQDTWSDPALTVLNANPVVLDASGRPTTDIWGSASYGAVITDALGANPRTFNNIQPDVGSGATIPALVSGDFLTNNGSDLLWQPIAQLPDPTGHAGQILFTDGTLDYWGAVPTPSSFTPTIDANSIKLGTVMIQWGSDTIAPTGSNTANKAFAFAHTFTTLYHVEAMLNGSSGTSAGIAIPILSVGARSVAGATAFIDMNQALNIINPSPFTWFAVGSVPA